jgi:hypothetical protein
MMKPAALLLATVVLSGCAISPGQHPRGGMQPPGQSPAWDADFNLVPITASLVRDVTAPPVRAESRNDALLEEMAAYWADLLSRFHTPPWPPEDVQSIRNSHEAFLDEYPDYNIDQQGEGAFWGVVRNRDYPLDEQLACEYRTFWVDFGDPPPDEPYVVDVEILAQLAWEETRVPDTEVSVNPAGVQKVNLPMWIWLDEADFAPVSVEARLDGRRVQQGRLDLATLSLGRHRLVVTATDAAGNKTTETVRFRVTTSFVDTKRLVKRFARAGSMTPKVKKDLLAGLNRAQRLAPKRPAKAVKVLRKVRRDLGEVRKAGHRKTLKRDVTALIRELRFDLALGRSGGEDTDFFARLHQAGGSIEYAPEAWVEEPVPQARARFEWLARRRFRMGQTHGRLVARQSSVGLLPVQTALAGLKVLYCLAAATAFAPLPARPRAA